MKAGIAALIAGYFLSQFFRAILAVLSTPLIRDIGVTDAQLGRASGFFLIAFALMQLPIGPALDRIGPRRIAATLLGVFGGAGALVVAFAQGGLAIQVGMAMLGVGCAPILMSSYYIFARSFPPHLFATLGSVTVAAGSFGNIGSTVPLAWAAETFGWRPALFIMAVAAVGVALTILALVPDPPRIETPRSRAPYREILRLRPLRPILPMMTLSYIAIGISGMWIGPFLADRYGLDAGEIGWAALFVSIAMIAGTLAFGPLDRIFRTRKWVAFSGNLLCAGTLVTLAAWPTAPLGLAVALIAGTLFFGAGFPVVMAHARAFAPKGREGTMLALLNFLSMGGAGLMQAMSGWVHTAWSDWSVLFLYFALPLLLAACIYAFSRDNVA